ELKVRRLKFQQNNPINILLPDLTPVV
ncbi:Pyridoxine/pyridoxamine 5'-phosphate oxidase, partial [Haemophilus influenzae]